MIIPMFLTEITDDRIRGAFLSSVYTSENLGFLIAYTIGHFFENMSAMPIFAIALIAVYMFLILFLPETPIFLMRKNKINVSLKLIYC